MLKALVLASLVSFISCAGQLERQTARFQKTFTRVKLASSAKVLAPNLDHPVHPLAESWDAEVYLVNFSDEQERKVRKAIGLIKKVIRSAEFKDRILNYSHAGKKGFTEPSGHTNAEIYQKILEGAEEMGITEKNARMDVELELFHQNSKTIGYTYPHSVRVWINTKYFDRYTPIKVADNLMHEWMHKLGFNHAMTWTEERDHSVPYAVGHLVEELAMKLE